jgi:hypothetical protein
MEKGKASKNTESSTFSLALFALIRLQISLGKMK